MSKKWLYMMAGAILIFAFGIGLYQSDFTQKKPSLSSDEVHAMVLEQYPGEISDIELMRNKKHAIYTVDLLYDDVNYNLQVDGHTGEIVHIKQLNQNLASDNPHKNMLESEAGKQDEKLKENDQKDSNTSSSDEEKKDNAENEQVAEQNSSKKKEKEDKKQNKNESNQTKNGSASVLTALDAIDIALKEFPGTVIEIERDKNNGRIIYEVELVSENEKSEMEIDAMSGDIISIKVKQSNDNGKYTDVKLSMAEAMKIALNQYNGNVLEGELDTDNGGYVYEFEIERNGIEAEIEIDGNTGEILEYDVD